MRLLDIKHRLDGGDIADVQRLLAAAEQADGRRSLSDHLWLDMIQGGSDGFAGLLVSVPGEDRLVAYAQLSQGNHSSALEVAVHPDHRADVNPISTELITAALEVVARSGGGEVHWWVSDPSTDQVSIAGAAGLFPGRQLYQMRRTLPAGQTAKIATRSFVVGSDEDAWLSVNNRAFAAHPEQGAWSLATLIARETEPWFDPEGFRLHYRDGRLAGFCWTKVHDDHAPVLGEIYVIAVDPDFHGLGLGKAMTLAGLDHLAAAGIPVAMLYVDADNIAAVGLYQKLGFTIHRTDQAFVGDIAGS